MSAPFDKNPPDTAAADLQCRELVELITAYLEDALPAPTRAQFDAHIRNCPDCCTYVSDMVLLVQRIGDLREQWPQALDRARLRTLFHNWRKTS